ncbi:hypothetical protein [Streptomyces solincola]|uniref:hypothetical protein n=1 Tax=Streptomyces solincola TaxID=2100817 RepID=UPI0011B28C73|nr:hypothetical protein [Streptomyces solincola]
MTAERLCGGMAVSADAGDALELITGSTRFVQSSKTNSVENAAQGIKEAGWPNQPSYGDVCIVYVPSPSHKEVEVTWRMESSAHKGPLASKFTELPIGERAGASPTKSFVTFACSDTADFPVAEPRYFTIEARLGGPPREPDGDVNALRDAYATVAHSFSLALAKELGCKDNGGLKSKPTLTPVKAAPSPSEGTLEDRQ